MDFLGDYKNNEYIPILLNTHKFETGEVYPAEITGKIYKIESNLSFIKDITLTPLENTTGTYYYIEDATNYSKGTFIIMLTAIIDLRTAKTCQLFKIITGGYDHG